MHALPGGRCLSLIHLGPYREIGRSYQRVFANIRERKLEPLVPSREIYLKGPGMIFKGDSNKYLTEIQLFIEANT